MPWQQMVVDVLGEIEPATGRLAYTEGGLTVPRQSGKSTLVEAKFCHRCTATSFYGPRQRLVYTAQTRIKAREKFEEDFIPDLEAAAAWRGRFWARMGNGNEHIRFANGSRFGLEASTEKAGHGGTLDEAYLDEAFAHQDFRLEQAFGPAMITRVNKLLMWISTAGWLGGSPYLETKVDAGRRAAAEGRTSGMAYFEWSADPDADPGDEATWWSCMPALGHTIAVADIRSEYNKAVDQGTVNEFRRAYLNQWVPKDMPDEWTVIPKAPWDERADPDSHPAGDLVLSVAFAHDQSAGAVGLSGWRPDDLLHVEVADYRPGTAWALEWLIDRWRRHQVLAVVVDDQGHEKTVIKGLEAAGVQVVKPGVAGVTEGYADFIADVLDAKTLRHRAQPDLDTALAGAVARDVGDAGQAWGRRKSSADICPLVAVTNAAWGLRKLTTGHGTPGVWVL
jgi:phage terminase large subunit-like protein